MRDLEFTSIFSLLEKANQQGIVLAYREGELSVKFSRSKKIDPVFLDQLKAGKDQLIEYFQSAGKEQLRRAHPAKNAAQPIELNGNVCYEIAPVQQWWVNDACDVELKNGQHGLFNFRIEGKGFMRDCLEKAVRYVVKRHESLRSAFPKTGNKHYLKLLDENAPCFEVDYHNISGIPEKERPALLNRLIYFYDRFQVQQGPLFITRLVQTDEATHFFSINIHHVIYDGWSVEVLINDLFATYVSCTRNKQPDLPSLKFQYKDYMAVTNRFIREYGEEHKKYWNDLYKQLPSGLIIPGIKDPVNGGQRYDIVRIFPWMPKEVVEGLNTLSSRYATGMFVILQAMFNLYIYQLTQQGDIVICTQTHGRDVLEGAEEQIGVYARMSVIRTVLDDADSLISTIKKVKTANEDMQQYWAYSLLDTFQSRVPAEQHKLSSFSKFTLEYLDTNGYYSRNISPENTAAATADINISILEEPEKKLMINTDMKLIFMLTRDHMDFKIIYDTDRYDLNTINGFVNGLREHIYKMLSFI